MANKGKSVRGAFGTIHHYDSNGHKSGSSVPGAFGGYTNYDANGNKIGHSSPGMFGGYSHYDKNGHKIGHSSPNVFGGYSHYDSKGHDTGHSDPSAFGGYHHSDGQGCYIATCVYGSYDCPSVWTLRRFRDDMLANTLVGRSFIRTYYLISPRLVQWFRNTSWFKKIWSFPLDQLVSYLNDHGVENTPYNDRTW